MVSHFVFSKKYILEDNRARLRPLRPADTHHLMSFADQQPELWQNSLMRVHSAEELTNYIYHARRARRLGHQYAFIVYDKKSKRFAGSTRFYDVEPAHQTTKCGFTWLGKEFQGTGLNLHCKWLMLDFAFSKMGMERVEFRADVRNLRSIGALRKIGCHEEGLLRSTSTRPDGSRRDSVVLSIIKPDWTAYISDMLLLKMHNHKN